MNCTSPSADAVRWDSEREFASEKFSGVHFRVSRMSFGRRLELARRVRELAQRVEFLAAGESVQEKLEAAVLSNEIDRLYVEWGLASVDGFLIDGEPATPKTVV